MRYACILSAGTHPYCAIPSFGIGLFAYSYAPIARFASSPGKTCAAHHVPPSVSSASSTVKSTLGSTWRHLKRRAGNGNRNGNASVLLLLSEILSIYVLAVRIPYQPEGSRVSYVSVLCQLRISICSKTHL